MRDFSKSEMIAISLFALVAAFVLGAIASNILIEAANKDNSVSDIVGAMGSIFAGVGTVVLALFAFKAYGEWQRQLGAKHTHECVMRIRKAVHSVNNTGGRLCELLKMNEKILKDVKDNKDTFYKFLGSLERDYLDFSASYGEYLEALNYIAEISGGSYLAEREEFENLSHDLSEVCNLIARNRLDFSFEQIEQIDKESNTNLMDVFETKEQHRLGRPVTKTRYNLVEATKFTNKFHSTITINARDDFKDIHQNKAS